MSTTLAGATYKIIDAQALINSQKNFVHFMFQFWGEVNRPSGDFSMYIFCRAVFNAYGPGRTYAGLAGLMTTTTVTLTREYYFPTLMLTKADFLDLCPNTPTDADIITLTPVLPTTNDLNIIYTATGPGKMLISKTLNPSPPYHG